MRNFFHPVCPLWPESGLPKQLQKEVAGSSAQSFNAANPMPLVADNPLTPAGLLAPTTYRNQLAFIDIFFWGMNNTPP